MTTTVPTTLNLRINLTPDSCLSPNQSKGRHWATLEKAKGDLITMTRQAFAQPGFGYYAPEPPLTLAFTIYWEKGRKRMDQDNLLASLKVCIDEIAYRTGINDKHFQFAPITQDRDPDGQGFMLVRLEGAA